jgi:hypothetical protein
VLTWNVSGKTEYPVELFFVFSSVVDNINSEDVFDTWFNVVSPVFIDVVTDVVDDVVVSDVSTEVASGKALVVMSVTDGVDSVGIVDFPGLKHFALKDPGSEIQNIV